MESCKYLIHVLLLLCLVNSAWPTCVKDGNFDLSALDRPEGWMASSLATNGNVTYYIINVCGALNSSSLTHGGCENSSVCQMTGNQSVSFGNAIVDKTSYVLSHFNLQQEFTLFLTTTNQCGALSDKVVYRSLIHFACGPNLGAPEIMTMTKCQASFYWKTSAACPVKPKVHQVPCYVHDEKGEKHDLSHLIKPAGGYFVSTLNPAIDFVINVCSDIVPDNKTKNCPANSSACRIIGSEYLLFGSPAHGLQTTSEGLILTYEPNESQSLIPAGCTLEPKTTILFKCPERGHSQSPRVISDFNCHYVVEWETEYACAESLLKANFKACQFITETHGIEIDLSPLKKKDFYRVPSNLSNSTQFAFSICRGLDNFNCKGHESWKSVSACMIDAKNHTSKIVGIAFKPTLIYADDQVTLTYPRGDRCENGLQHTTVIKFLCNPNASSGGEGVPQHVSSDYCVHLFEWSTKYACLKHPLDTPCSVIVNKKIINLQKLFLIEGDAWEAIDRRTVLNPINVEYYINVCGQVSGLGNLSQCGESSSACVLRKDGTYLNLGSFNSSPVYDVKSNNVKLEYTGGSPCKNGTLWKSTIYFICRPGRINSEPILTRIDEEECLYEFEWQTAEACPEGVITGSDCKVFDDDLGINYDLNPLKSKVYEVDTQLYKFFVGVCEPIVDTPCSKNRNATENIGVCQVDKSQKAWKTGESNSHLSYTDGVVNLTYLSGDPYNDPNNTARMTIIIFICDYKAGYGNPYFIEEVNYAYVFHWYTSLVCPSSAPIECMAHDPNSHLIYDLSSLSVSRQNWITYINDNDKERQIYLNVCRSLTRPSTCDASAAACVVETTESGEKVVLSNIGRATNAPVLEGPGHLSLTYTHGNPCIAYGENTTYSTVIHFLCDDQMSKNGPTFLSKIGACEYTFLWTTKAACPTGNLKAYESCQITDPGSGFTFDLTSLYTEMHPYSVQTPSGIIQFNVCGRIFEGCYMSDGKSPQTSNVSVCKVDSDGKMIEPIALAESYTLHYSVGQDLTLTYKFNSTSKISNNQEVVIKFPCYNGIVDPKPKFIKTEGNRYILEMETRLTCLPRNFDCTVVDSKGNEYDLSSLSKFSGGNWEVADVNQQHLRYHINFCRPLNKVTSYKCPGGASAACQTSNLLKGSTGHDLGRQISPVVINDVGTLIIRYSNGSYCHNGQFRRSTTISLFCSEEQGTLIFMGETPECEYLFSLNTPLACPVQSSHGSNCTVKDPTFGYMFDLNPLKSKINNYNITVGQYVYSFNVCDKLNGFENKCSNSSACQTKLNSPNFSKSLGLPNDNLFYRKGLITLVYESGSSNCHGTYNRSTKITFTCHHGLEDRDGPTFVSEAEDCTYLFEWPTIHACPPFDLVECSVIDENGITYDFSKLSLPNDNYYIKNSLSENTTFVINLCRSIVHTPNSLCSYIAASCLVDSSHSNKSINLGRVQQTPYIENGKIKVNYTSGDVCNDIRDNSTRYWQTVIEFNCDEYNIESGPEFVGKDDCTYYFDWHTAYACPPKPIKVSDDCTVEDPQTGHLYNLSSLKNHSPFRTQVGHHQYYISICGKDNSNPCGPGAGMCQEEMTGQKRHWNGGKVNHKLEFNNGILLLNYSSGDSCHSGRFQRNTIIEFHCGQGMGEPKFQHESFDCTYFFSWKTELACQTSLHCAIKKGDQYLDLSSLTRTYYTANSGIIDDDSIYYISICSSLPRIQFAQCPPGSGICKVKKDLAHSSDEALSLGKVEYPPFMDFMGHATVIYTNGSACDKNGNMTNRARIIFLCDPEAAVGEPELIEKESEDCFYLFEWRTNLVCPEKPIDESVMSCNYADKSKGIYFDLSLLQKSSEPYQVENDKDGGKFLLKLCSSLQSSNISNCKNSGVCAVGTNNSSLSYGIASSQKFTYDGQRLRLTFYDGDDCPSGFNGKRTAEVFFVCDANAGIGKPVLHKKYTCLVVFLWKTSLVCQNKQQCSFDVGDNHYDFNLISSLSHNWNTSNSQNIFLINLCQGVRWTPDNLNCTPSAAICMVDHYDSHITLGTVQTMEAKSINSSDLLLTFESGDKRACMSITSATPLTPVTRIFMRCGNSLGNPRIFSGPDSKCYYDFVWESSLACGEKTEQVMIEKDGLIKDPRFGFTLNVTEILNRTFIVKGISASDEYVFEINFNGVYQNGTTDGKNPCSQAAICQTKPGSKFFRDVGSFDTRIFLLRGSELHATFTSYTRPCGKNKAKNVTTVFKMHCVSAAGLGTPIFLYETGDCDYVFEWETITVCPEFHKLKPFDPVPNPYKEAVQSSHKAEVIVGVLFAVIILMVIGFILMKRERRAMISHRVRSVFGGVSLPYLRYKRFNGERLVLVDAAQPHPYEDERDVELLT